MNIIKRSCLAIAMFIVVVVCGSWGFLVHKTVHQLAVYKLPKKMQKFFYRNMSSLVNDAGRPDTRRNTDSTEAPKHFIDTEAYVDSAVHKLPLHRNEAVRMFTEDSLQKYGYLPYHIIYMKTKLTEAFKTGNADSILFYAVDLGHYIGDANVPLHTSINYDGQLSNQKGLHSLWESAVPELKIDSYDLHNKHKASYLQNSEVAIMKAIQRSYALTPGVFAKEKEVSAAFSDSEKYKIEERRGRQIKSYSPAFVEAYAVSLKSTVNDQLIKSADLIADFWYTSWVDAGKPDLSHLIVPASAGNDKKGLKAEKKSFRKNMLINNNLLRSKMRTDERPAE